MELYTMVAEGYRLTVDVDQIETGDYGWRIYLAMSKETGRGTQVASGPPCLSAAEAAAAGMRALERYKVEQRVTVLMPATPAVVC